MRIGILTGGGDVPGLNPCIKAVVNRAEDAGIEVVGIRRGWGGLLNYNLDDISSDSAEWVRAADHAPMCARSTATAARTCTPRAPTRPRSARRRCPSSSRAASSTMGEKQLADCTPHVLRVLEHLGIDALIPIGGDDTLSFAVRLHQEGVRVIAIPKTMDNDVFGTDYCIGFSTAVTRSVEFINCAAHARRLARADRGGRAVRPQLRRDGADLGLPGRCRPRADLRGAVRHRAAGASWWSRISAATPATTRWW